MVNNTIFGEMQGYWMKGSTRHGLSPKWVNESPVYVFRDRSFPLVERGSPASLVVDPSLVTGFLLGVAASVVGNYLYTGKRRKR